MTCLSGVIVTTLALDTAHRVLKARLAPAPLPRKHGIRVPVPEETYFELRISFPIERTKLQISVTSLKSDLGQDRGSCEIVECPKQEENAALENRKKK